MFRHLTQVPCLINTDGIVSYCLQDDLYSCYSDLICVRLFLNREFWLEKISYGTLIQQVDYYSFTETSWVHDSEWYFHSWASTSSEHDCHDLTYNGSLWSFNTYNFSTSIRWNRNVYVGKSWLAKILGDKSKRAFVSYETLIFVQAGRIFNRLEK